MLEELMQEIETLIETTSLDSAAYRQKKKDIRQRYAEYLDKEEGLTADKIKPKIKELGKLIRGKENAKKVLSGKFVLDPLLRLRMSDEKGIPYDIDAILNSRLGLVNIGVDNEEVSSKQFKTTIDNYAKTLSEEQSSNLKANFTKIKRAITTKSKKAERVARSKTVNVDINTYIGATDLSKGIVREDIYEFWGEVSKKYSKFKTNLDKFFDEIISSKDIIEEISGKDVAENIVKGIVEIKNKYGNKNLEYIVDFSKVNIPVTADPKKRLIAAFDRIIDAEQLSYKTEEVINSDIEEDDYGSTQRAWEQAYMEAENTLNSSGERGEIEIGLAGDVLDYDIVSLQEAEKQDTDPLLAYEIMKNTKLLALDTKSEAILKEALDDMREKALYLDFRTDLKRLIEELKDTLIIDTETYTLPISVLDNNDFAKFVKIEGTLTTALAKEEVTKDILEVLDDLFEEIHGVLTTEKFGFAGGVRATGRGGTLGGALPPRQEARGTSMQSLVNEPKRQVPVGMGTRGKLKQEIKNAVINPLKDLLEAYSEYYIDPLYIGRLPIEVPSYSTGRGAKALSVFLQDVGGVSITADSNIMLATTEKATLSVQTMRDLANFLEKLDSPKITVDDGLVRLAKNFSIAMTDIFGQEEKNRNYASAVLKHFMTLTDDDQLIDEELFGRRIGVRANEWQREYKRRVPQPIFALPYFVDTQQSLMTKDSKRKQQYNRLRQVLDEVENDLPLIFTKMLKAHDAIRKAMGKSIIYGFMPLKHESYEKMIDVLYKEEQIDMSHLEVSNIVKSDDSHSNLSKEYGITTEQVYLIKANFR